ncbi:MAG TPA: hypothetical protein VL053_18805, partial [Arachidicoccus sp.]|nr:hypothetical protein [Arachidicoccus sp.]
MKKTQIVLLPNKTKDVVKYSVGLMVLSALIMQPGVSWAHGHNIVVNEHTDQALKQVIIVSGRVLDKSGNPLQGVSIQVKGTSKG